MRAVPSSGKNVFFVMSLKALTCPLPHGVVRVGGSGAVCHK